MMEFNDWHQRWEQNQIAFHEGQPNVLLVAYFDALALEKGSRVMLPLCGKTVDIHWLLAQGYQVVGIELSEIAVKQLFEDLAITPTVTEVGALKCYEAANVVVYVGDFFELNANELGTVDCVYDRAALVALTESQRKRYTAHLRQVTQHAPQLVICYVYDQSVMAGPPHSITEDEMRQHYAEYFELNHLAEVPVEGGLKGVCPSTEHVWHLV
jgi:thiopurine S-methyltransferase